MFHLTLCRDKRKSGCVPGIASGKFLCGVGALGETATTKKCEDMLAKARFLQQNIRKPQEADIDRLRRQTILGLGDASSGHSNREFAQNMLLSSDGNGVGAFQDVGMLLGDVRGLLQPDNAEKPDSSAGGSAAWKKSD